MSVNYQKSALRSENRDHLAVAARFREMTHYQDDDARMQRLLHAAMGLSTEAGELLDVFKKFLYYGKPLDMVNLIEELGDIMWYLAQAADAIGVSFETIQVRNLLKLTQRYPHKFTDALATDRDLPAERKALEDDLDGR